MTQNAADLFRICDKEDKGFVTKRDMQRMRKLDDDMSCSMDPEQLESVFDTLDIDGNGYLTFDEFAAGFQHFLGVSNDATGDADDVIGVRLTKHINANRACIATNLVFYRSCIIPHIMI